MNKPNNENWLQTKINAFKSLPKEDKTTIYLFGGLITLLIVAIIVAVILITGTSRKNSDISIVTEGDSSKLAGTELDADYKASEYDIDESKYADTFLQETADAGKKYLEDTLFIGDSNTLRMNSYGLFTLQNILAIEGIGINSIPTLNGYYFQGMENGVTLPRAVAMLQPRRIVMNFGTNDADGNLKPEQFIAGYKKALEAIKAEYPYVDIILATIPPVAMKRDYNNLSMKTIDEFNKALVDFAQKESYKVLNYNDILKDKNGYIKPKYAVGDGLHLTQEAYKEILKYIRTHEYKTEDTRPTLKAIPQRRKAPVVSEIASSSAQLLEAVEITFVVETRDKQGNVLGTVAGGRLSSADGGVTQYVLPMESSRKMEATPNSNFTFAGWYRDGSKISGEKTIVFTVPENITDGKIVIKAVFVRDIEPSPSPSPSASISPSPSPTASPIVTPTPAPTPETPTPPPTPETPTPPPTPEMPTATPDATAPAATDSSTVPTESTTG